MADDVLHMGVRGVTDLMVMPGLINLDFADIRTVMGEMGKAMMGTGEARAGSRLRRGRAAISNPLLEDHSMKGAKGVLINITGGLDMTLHEVDEAANRIREEVDPTPTSSSARPSMRR
jgi:cell division protein FtsZ